MPDLFPNPTTDIWQLTSDNWQLTTDNWQLTSDFWHQHLTSDMEHRTSGIGHHLTSDNLSHHVVVKIINIMVTLAREWISPNHRFEINPEEFLVTYIRRHIIGLVVPAPERHRNTSKWPILDLVTIRHNSVSSWYYPSSAHIEEIQYPYTKLKSETNWSIHSYERITKQNSIRI